jgi:general secretion pathway protein I
MKKRLPQGFTLIEVLVALGIVSIALTAGLKATAALTRNTERQADMLLARLCAENELIKLRLSRQMPGVGDTTVVCEQAGVQMTVLDHVRPTPNPNFLRVDALVQRDQQTLYQLTALVSRF